MRIDLTLGLLNGSGAYDIGYDTSTTAIKKSFIVNKDWIAWRLI